jgi:hypothetical protein
MGTVWTPGLVEDQAAVEASAASVLTIVWAEDSALTSWTSVSAVRRTKAAAKADRRGGQPRHREQTPRGCAIRTGDPEDGRAGQTL